jgi:zinc transporter ZupT
MYPFSASVFLATALAWAGSFTALVFRQAGSRFMRPLIYLSLLFFAASAVFDILPESKHSLSWPIFAFAVAVGYGAFGIIGTYISPICPSCAMREFENGRHHSHGGGLAIFSLVLGIHCFIDGLGLRTASTVETALGLRVFAAIAVHKLPEGFALGLVLMAGGRTPWQALRWASGIETSTLAGGLAGVLWAHPSGFWQALVLAQMGGTLLYLSASGLRDLLASHQAPVVTAP